MYVLIVSFAYPDTIVLRILHLDTFVRLIQPLLDADVSNDNRASHEEEIVKAVLANSLRSIYAQSWNEDVLSNDGLSGYNITKIIHIPVMDC